MGNSLVYAVLDLWMAIPFLLVWSLGLALVSALAITFVGAVAAAALTLRISLLFCTFERFRANQLLSAEASEPPSDRNPEHGFLRAQIYSPNAWKALGYLFIKSSLSPLVTALLLTLWSAGIGLLLAPLLRLAFPGNTVELGFTDITTNVEALVAVGIGVLIMLVGAPAATLATGRLNRGLVRSLLSSSSKEQLRAQIVEVSTQRSAAIDAAEAERRRIERDLHDGAQQRLVSLGMTIGMAREKIDRDPAASRELLDAAVTDAQLVMAELRSIARGIHPAVLEDRGLDAALSSVAARCPIPVTIDVRLPQRLGPDVEGAAYYVVSESLTNIAKHAHATEASVSVSLVTSPQSAVKIVITDNGVGGANSRSGGGLAGLSGRLAALGGTLRVHSPMGGPTVLTAEIPR